MAGKGVCITLLALSALGFWTLWGFPARNNLLHFLGELSKPGASIPGPTYAPMKQTYTGIARLDKRLTILVGFFYTAIDGNRIDITLSFLNLGSQVLAAWLLITTESYRVGNQGIFVVQSITIFGLFVAVVGYACVAPIYFVLHLWLSHIPSQPRAYKLVLQHPIRLALAPVSTLIGFGIPSALMALPAPRVLSFDTKQTITAVQQAWPIWIFLTQKTLEAAASLTSPMLKMRTERQKRDETVTYMRRAYLVALLSSTTAHLAYVVPGLAAWLTPGLVSAKLRVQLAPDDYFIPPNPFRADVKAGALPDAALWFLQWDLVVGLLATLVWGVAVRLEMSGRVGSLRAWIRALFKYGAIATVVGPAGAAVVAIWGRDELVFKEKDA